MPGIGKRHEQLQVYGTCFATNKAANHGLVSSTLYTNANKRVSVPLVASAWHEQRWVIWGCTCAVGRVTLLSHCLRACVWQMDFNIRCTSVKVPTNSQIIWTVWSIGSGYRGEEGYRLHEYGNEDTKIPSEDWILLPFKQRLTRKPRAHKGWRATPISSSQVGAEQSTARWQFGFHFLM